MNTSRLFKLLLFVCVMVAAACDRMPVLPAQEGPAPEVAAVPETVRPEPTAVQLSTATPLPTATALPTSTPAPTATPTSTPTPSPTPLSYADHYRRGVALLEDETLTPAITQALALEAFSECVALNPDFAPALRARARLYAGCGRIDDALADMDRLIALAPTDAKALYERACLLADNGNYKQAIADLDASIELQPENAEAFFERGMVNLAQYAPQAALADFTEVAALNEYVQEHSGAWSADDMALAARTQLGRADALWMLEMPMEAALASADAVYYDASTVATHCSQLLEEGGGNAKTYFHRGLAYAALGQFADSDADFTLARLLTEDNFQIAAYLYQRALIMSDGSARERAIADLEEVLEIGPEWLVDLAYQQLAYAHELLGNYVEAEACYNEAVARRPDAWQPVLDRAFFFMLLDRMEEAVADLCQARLLIGETLPLLSQSGDVGELEYNLDLIDEILTVNGTSCAPAAEAQPETTAWVTAAELRLPGGFVMLPPAELDMAPGSLLFGSSVGQLQKSFVVDEPAVLANPATGQLLAVNTVFLATGTDTQAFDLAIENVDQIAEIYIGYLDCTEGTIESFALSGADDIGDNAGAARAACISDGISFATELVLARVGNVGLFVLTVARVDVELSAADSLADVADVAPAAAEKLADRAGEESNAMPVYYPSIGVLQFQSDFFGTLRGTLAQRSAGML